ncbi:flavin dependent monooxygenase [Rhodotorula toruloides]|uniref:Flavin dependent monooxygenase n=1 Tax=Rhodotorula toruloides TaxID=5286 RepID=A0A511KJK2_RHOTO|nr:flavin dependent monooxygenase [Rhodotorula toruloides]
MVLHTLRCLVVGAGSSGLAACEQATEAGIDVVCLEARAGVGGAWRYEDDPGKCSVQFDDDGWATVTSPGESDERGAPPPTPMYSSLRTNVPTSLMQFRDRPFPPTVGLFCSHNQVQSYLEDFARPFLPLIRFNTRLVSLRHTLPSDLLPVNKLRRRWLASYRSTLEADAVLEMETFDCVMVANGHYARPYIPWTEGLGSWKGELLHARWYREAKQFEQKTVIVVGNSASGYDITRELASSIHTRRQFSPSASLPKIYQSARSPPQLGIPWDAPEAPEYSKEVRTKPPIRRVDGRRIEFEDGSVAEDVDTIIFATGYFFSFPFLSPTDAPFSSHPLTYAPSLPSSPDLHGPPSAKGGLRVHNLDERMTFYLPDTSLAFLGLPYLVIPFPLAQLQARLASKHFSSTLPRPLTFRPDPAMASPTDPTDVDGAPESRKTVTWGHPKQFDMHDRWLRETGDVCEDGVEGKGDEQGGLTGGRSRWELTSAAERDLRMGAKGLRKAVLGY